MVIVQFMGGWVYSMSPISANWVWMRADQDLFFSREIVFLQSWGNCWSLQREPGSGWKPRWRPRWRSTAVWRRSRRRSPKLFLRVSCGLSAQKERRTKLRGPRLLVMWKFISFVLSVERLRGSTLVNAVGFFPQTSSQKCNGRSKTAMMMMIL